MTNKFANTIVTGSILALSTALLLASPSAHAGKLKFGALKSSGPTMNCTVPNHIKCTISSSKGIKRVKIQSNTGQGTINVVNKTYRSCPKSVSVSWDSAYPAHNKQIVECTSAKLKLKKS